MEKTEMTNNLCKKTTTTNIQSYSNIKHFCEAPADSLSIFTQKQLFMMESIREIAWCNSKRTLLFQNPGLCASNRKLNITWSLRPFAAMAEVLSEASKNRVDDLYGSQYVENVNCSI